MTERGPTDYTPTPSGSIDHAIDGVEVESPFRLETKKTLAEQVVDRIRELIINGSLNPGDRLPPEIELAQMMGVSRTALREGMRTLEAHGLLVTRPGVGTLVGTLGSDQLVQPLALFVDASGGAISFDEFHTVRTIIEVEIAALAANNPSTENLKTLEGLMSEMVDNAGDVKAFASFDASFHQLLAAMTSNPLLELFLSALRALLESHITEVVSHIDVEKDVLPYHEAILTAVQNRDANGAREAMRSHLLQVAKNYETAVADLSL